MDIVELEVVDVFGNDWPIMYVSESQEAIVLKHVITSVMLANPSKKIISRCCRRQNGSPTGLLSVGKVVNEIPVLPYVVEGCLS